MKAKIYFRYLEATLLSVFLIFLVIKALVCLFVFLALQPTVVLFSQAGSGL
jgi:hypothetical protein